MLKRGDMVEIHSYKHDHHVHRTWNNITVLEITKNCLVVGNYKSRVVESNGRFWTTKEPAICFFYDNKWFNVIAMLKKEGITYYCNLSSPYVYDDEAIKYIDYDLDVKVFNDYSFKVLDRDEYKEHLNQMHYPDKLKKIIEAELLNLIELIKRKEPPFNHELIYNYYEMYKNINKGLKDK